MRTLSPRQMTTGTSPTATWKRSNIACTVSSLSTSRYANGCPLRAKNSFEPQRPRRVHGSDEDRVAQPGRHEPHAPQDERAHEELAQLRVRLDDAPEGVRIEVERLAILADAAADQAPSPREDARLARELARVVHDDGVLAGEAGPHHGQRSREEHVHARVGLPLVEEDLARRGSAAARAWAAMRAICAAVERREHLRAPLCENLRHAPPSAPSVSSMRPRVATARAMSDAPRRIVLHETPSPLYA